MYTQCMPTSSSLCLVLEVMRERRASGRDKPPRQGRAFPLSNFWGRATGASDALQQRASYLNDVTRIFYRLHLPIDIVAHSKTMTDRATKRLRRLSTEYEESEDNNEWNNSRYVADIPSTARNSAPFFAPRAARHKAANWSERKQSAAGSSVTSECHDRSPPRCATCAVILAHIQQKKPAI
jgi:hypothetical protein